MRILIVDDDKLSAEMTLECLTMESDMNVQIANDGATALRMMVQFLPEVVLLDIEMPDVSGLDLAPQLRAVDPDNRARIIIFSGMVRGPNHLCLPEGIDAWLAKPALLDELIACIVRPNGPHRFDR